MASRAKSVFSSGVNCRMGLCFRHQSIRTIMLSKNLYVFLTSSFSVLSYPRDKVLDRLESLQDAVQAANWSDSVNLVLNVPFWDAELENVDHMVEPYHQDPEIGGKVRETHRLFDCLFASEDVRDHINELIEVSTRTSGIMGTGYLGTEKLENVDEQLNHCVKAYEGLLEKYPEFKPKIEQSVGHGMAILRSKYKFDYQGMHRFFY
jgi:hypothetical protein